MGQQTDRIISAYMEARESRRGALLNGIAENIDRIVGGINGKLEAVKIQKIEAGAIERVQREIEAGIKRFDAEYPSQLMDAEAVVAVQQPTDTRAINLKPYEMSGPVASGMAIALGFAYLIGRGRFNVGRANYKQGEDI